MNKTFNLIIMVLMFALAAREAYVMSEVGEEPDEPMWQILVQLDLHYTGASVTGRSS